MRFEFYVNKGRGARHRLASADIVFDEVGPLEGAKLTGFTLWARRDGGPGIAVTVPGRAYQQAGATHYLDYLRDADPDPGGAVQRIKKAMIEAFLAEYPKGAAKAKKRRASGADASAASPAGQQEGRPLSFREIGRAHV